MNSYLTRPLHVSRPPAAGSSVHPVTQTFPLARFHPPFSRQRPRCWLRLGAGVVCRPLWGHFAAVYPKEWQLYEMILISSPLLLLATVVVGPVLYHFNICIAHEKEEAAAHKLFSSRREQEAGNLPLKSIKQTTRQTANSEWWAASGGRGVTKFHCGKL